MLSKTSKPAFLVEGSLEQKFIQQICPNCPVQKINCNGEDVCLDSIAKRVGTLGRLLHKRFSPIIVIFDREMRKETSDQLRDQFKKAIAHEKIQVPIIVGIPDRDIEAWILSDFEFFAQAAGIDRELLTPSYEGQKGKTVIRGLIGAKRKYIETVDGVTWLKSCRATVMAQNSQSFQNLFRGLRRISCWWLDQQDLPKQDRRRRNLEIS